MAVRAMAVAPVSVPAVGMAAPVVATAASAVMAAAAQRPRVGQSTPNMVPRQQTPSRIASSAATTPCACAFGSLPPSTAMGMRSRSTPSGMVDAVHPPVAAVATPVGSNSSGGLHHSPSGSSGVVLSWCPPTSAQGSARESSPPPRPLVGSASTAVVSWPQQIKQQHTHRGVVRSPSPRRCASPPRPVSPVAIHRVGTSAAAPAATPPVPHACTMSGSPRTFASVSEVPFIVSHADGASRPPSRSRCSPPPQSRQQVGHHQSSLSPSSKQRWLPPPTTATATRSYEPAMANRSYEPAAVTRAAIPFRAAATPAAVSAVPSTPAPEPHSCQEQQPCHSHQASQLREVHQSCAVERCGSPRDSVWRRYFSPGEQVGRPLLESSATLPGATHVSPGSDATVVGGMHTGRSGNSAMSNGSSVATLVPQLLLEPSVAWPASAGALGGASGVAAESSLVAGHGSSQMADCASSVGTVNGVGRHIGAHLGSDDTGSTMDGSGRMFVHGGSCCNINVIAPGVTLGSSGGSGVSSLQRAMGRFGAPEPPLASELSSTRSVPLACDLAAVASGQLVHGHDAIGTESEIMQSAMQSFILARSSSAVGLPDDPNCTVGSAVAHYQASAEARHDLAAYRTPPNPRQLPSDCSQSCGSVNMQLAPPPVCGEPGLLDEACGLQDRDACETDVEMPGVACRGLGLLPAPVPCDPRHMHAPCDSSHMHLMQLQHPPLPQQHLEPSIQQFRQDAQLQRLPWQHQHHQYGTVPMQCLGAASLQQINADETMTVTGHAQPNNTPGSDSIMSAPIAHPNIAQGTSSVTSGAPTERVRPLQPRVRGLPGNISVPPVGQPGCTSKPTELNKEQETDRFGLGMALAAVRMRDLAELRSFRHPPAVVCQVLEAVAVLLGVADTRWSLLRKLLDANLIGRLASFDPSLVSWAQAERLRVLLQVPTFTDGALWDRCAAAAPLAAWCTAVGAYLEQHPPLAPPPPPSSGQSSFRGIRSEANFPAVAQVPAPYTVALPGGDVVSTEEAPPMAPRGFQVQRQASPPRVKPDLGGLHVEPDLWSMSEAELTCVHDLRVSRDGVGSVTFQGPTDCRELVESIAQMIVLNPGEVIVYPDQDFKPAVGEGLNKPASVELYGCLPKSLGFRDRKARERYKKRVQRMTEEKGAEFVDYDGEQGIWQFRVMHF